MKRILVIFLILSSASLAFGRFDFGAKFGMNHSFIRSNEFADQTYWEANSEFKGISAETMGAFASIGLETFTIHLEAYYAGEGFSIHSPYSQYIPQPDVEVYTLNINTFALLRYYLKHDVFAKPYISTGLNVGFPLDVSVLGADDFDIENFHFTKIGLCVAVGANFLDVADLELRYTAGLNDIYSGNNGEITRSNLISLSLGVYFLEIFNRPGKHARF